MRATAARRSELRPACRTASRANAVSTRRGIVGERQYTDCAIQRRIAVRGLRDFVELGLVHHDEAALEAEFTRLLRNQTGRLRRAADEHRVWFRGEHAAYAAIKIGCAVIRHCVVGDDRERKSAQPVEIVISE